MIITFVGLSIFTASVVVFAARSMLSLTTEKMLRDIISQCFQTSKRVSWEQQEESPKDYHKLRSMFNAL
jgi:hypothetical protein